MPTITIGPGIKIKAGNKIGTESGGASPLSSANIYFPMQTIIDGAADGVSIPAITNYGTDGATYDGVSVPGRTQPTVATVDGYKALQLDGYTSNQWGYNLANSFTVPSGSLFMVGWESTGSGFFTRCMGFGGQRFSPYQICFFGYSDINNSGFLFRDTVDGGMTQVVSTVVGMKAFGIVKTGSTVVYYDNNTTPVTYSSPCTGTYGFNTVGYRSYGIDQPSTGYLGDVAWFDQPLSNTDAGAVMTYLKNLYGIV